MCYLSLEQLAMRITEGMTLSKAKKTIMYLPVLGTVTCLQWWPFFDAITLAQVWFLSFDSLFGPKTSFAGTHQKSELKYVVASDHI